MAHLYTSHTRPSTKWPSTLLATKALRENTQTIKCAKAGAPFTGHNPSSTPQTACHPQTSERGAKLLLSQTSLSQAAKAHREKISSKVNLQYNNHPKRYHKQFKNRTQYPNTSNQTIPALIVVHNKVGTPASNPTSMIQEVHKHFSSEHSKCVPDDLPSPHWENATNPCPFHTRARGDPTL
jgi:hypothetical protein